MEQDTFKGTANLMDPEDWLNSEEFSEEEVTGSPDGVVENRPLSIAPRMTPEEVRTPPPTRFLAPPRIFRNIRDNGPMEPLSPYRIRWCRCHPDNPGKPHQ